MRNFPDLATPHIQRPAFPVSAAAPYPSSFIDRFIARVETTNTKDCWRWRGAPDTGSLGYGRVSNDGRSLYAHRVAFEISSGKSIEPGRVIRHKCDNPICCRPSHLRNSTQAENTLDMCIKERQRGKLTRKQVLEIDRLDREDPKRWTRPRLARRFKVSETSIRRLLSGATWSSVTGRHTNPRHKPKPIFIIFSKLLEGVVRPTKDLADIDLGAMNEWIKVPASPFDLIIPAPAH